ncbi:FAD-dependent monooxygenase [Undibacterium arcticum]|uniref:FAD-dependent monooxygenase n=1 Tax=Undibacterium arcticum TaxID=1762892 RepID=UPI003620176B
MKTNHVSVLIVGAGPVGLATAALLRQHGVAVRIIEKNKGPTPYSKAIGIHARTLESMHALGLTEQLIADGHPMHKFRLVEDGRTIMAAGFSNIGSPYSFVLGLPQSRTEQNLLARFQELGGSVEWGTHLTGITSCGNPGMPDAPAVVRVQDADGVEQTISCNWLIGADGSRSAVREMAKIAFPGGDYGNAFILGDVKIDWDGPKYDLQFFLSGKGYLLLIPMPNGMHRIIAQTDQTYEDFQQGERPATTLQELQQIVNRNGPGNLRVHSPQWLTCAPFYHRLADTAVKDRIVLVGDAFHLFSPLGAQGLNTGFQDAFNLGWKLAFIERAGPIPSCFTLTRTSARQLRAGSQQSPRRPHATLPRHRCRNGCCVATPPPGTTVPNEFKRRCRECSPV